MFKKDNNKESQTSDNNSEKDNKLFKNKKLSKLIIICLIILFCISSAAVIYVLISQKDSAKTTNEVQKQAKENLVELKQNKPAISASDVQKQQYYSDYADISSAAQSFEETAKLFKEDSATASKYLSPDQLSSLAEYFVSINDKNNAKIAYQAAIDQLKLEKAKNSSNSSYYIYTITNLEKQRDSL